MAWSDAAREAALEARRATAKARKSQDPRDHAAAANAHMRASDAHEADRRSSPSGDKDRKLSISASEHHMKMAEIHDKKAQEGFAKNRQAAADKKINDDARRMYPEAYKNEGKVYGEQRGSQFRVPKSEASEKLLASDKAAKATREARRNTDPQKAPELHLKAAEAHSAAATAHMNAGNGSGAEHHAKMEEQHRDAADRAKSMNFKRYENSNKKTYR